ncbi:hypothetical protein LH19_27550 (plasmid) [Sphingopyxis macrogoltabida]|nr:hypothetical protein LH19_27550 [Sphingopyxis macrogoltabida]
MSAGHGIAIRPGRMPSKGRKRRAASRDRGADIRETHKTQRVLLQMQGLLGKWRAAQKAAPDLASP